jgi:hypothetical protein
MNNEIDLPKRDIYKTIVIKGCLIFIIIALIGLFWLLRDQRVKKILKNEESEISQLIVKTIHQNAELPLILPDIFILNSDTSIVAKLSDTILGKIANQYLEIYTKNNSLKDAKQYLQPYFLFPDQVRKDGSFRLTEKQIDDLKNHLIYLASEVDLAISETKKEIDKEINRINTWVTIWIGILAIFGTIIPFFYNIKSSESMKELKDKADVAYGKAELAVKKLNTHEPNLKKIGGLEGKIKTIEQTINSVQKTSISAKDESEKAKIRSTEALNKVAQTELIMTTLNMINKLNMFDPSNLIHIEQPEEAFDRSMINIHTHLSQCQNIFDNPVIIDSLRQLATHLHLISIYSFIDREKIAKLNELSIIIDETLSNNYTKESFVIIMNLLKGISN